MRLAAVPVQLALPMPEAADPGQRWQELPEVTRMQVLGLLARLIARSVLTGQEAGGE
jgi:hypothetical protein